jgi:hypothetical protein
MQISNKLNQFNQYPTLFIVTGDFEAHLHLAQNGSFNQLDSLVLHPREEAKEKQGFIHASKGALLGAVSHRENYREDLKVKFAKQLNGKVFDLIHSRQIKDICLFAPRHSANFLKTHFHDEIKKKIHAIIYGEYTKLKTEELIKFYERQIQQMYDFSIHRHDNKEPILKEQL